METSLNSCDNGHQLAQQAPATKCTRESTVRKDIGMLMFLLAAETAVAAGITEPMANAAAATSLCSEGAGLAKAVCLVGSDTSSLGGDTDSASLQRTPSPEHDEQEASVSTEEVFARASAAKNLFANEVLLSGILSYVPWQQAMKLRSVSRLTNTIISRTTMVRQLPGTSVPAIWMPVPTNLEETSQACEAALQFLHPSIWRCVKCGYWNGETRVLCGNRGCQFPSLTHANCSRIFIGQLRRDDTVPLLKWMVDFLLEEPASLRNVENHRNTATNRGKGCAWAYFDNEDMAQKFLTYHRRLFLDSVDGVEGFWLVSPRYVEELQAVANERGYAPNRAKALPRNALVVEIPATGSAMLGRELLAANYDIECQYVPSTHEGFPAVIPTGMQAVEPTPIAAPVAAPSAINSQPQPVPPEPLDTQALAETSAPLSASASRNTPPSGRFHHDPYSTPTFAPSAELPSAADMLPPPSYEDSLTGGTASEYDTTYYGYGAGYDVQFGYGAYPGADCSAYGAYDGWTNFNSTNHSYAPYRSRSTRHRSYPQGGVYYGAAYYQYPAEEQ
jgi:hypothetical protein